MRVCMRVCMYTYAYIHVCHRVHVELRAQISEISFFTPQCGFQKPISGHKSWWQMPSPIEPSHWAHSIVYYKHNALIVNLQS